MKKKLLALVLCLAMTLTMMTGCSEKGSEDAGGDKAKTEDTEKKDNTDDTKKEDAADPTATPIPENKVTGNVDAKDAFVVYGWNTDIQDTVLKAFAEKYPEDAKRIVFVNTGGSDFYQQKIDPLLEDPNNKYYPDMYGMEMDYIRKYTDEDITMPMKDLGIGDEQLKNMYQYTVEAARNKKGVLKGVSWQACPGGLVYRRSLAKKYLGVSEPEEVQKFFKDWETTKKTAQTIKEKSSEKCRLYCGYTELQRPYQAQRKDAWVDDDSNLKIDKTMQDYMEVAKEYVDNGFASAGSADQQWNDNWSATMGDDNIFAYTACTWFNQFTLRENVDKKTYGDWALIQGPTEFYWGGTWMGVGSECSDKKLAAKIISVLCDKDCMKSIYKNKNDYPNNKEAVAELAQDEKAVKDSDVGKLFGGQNFIKFFQPIAEKITLPKMCGEDFYINNLYNDQVAQYATGKKDKDTAIADFKAKVKDQYDYVNVE
ncbi:ABC-type sugar transport system, periplasmic component [Lachnospiraceae bacterium KM106-2]|nr:ABC-type sugar transport system, periplasmic component [Lachnospiraceae bacterium KM106-2]